MANKEIIMIIDDEPDFVEALQMTLEAKSYQVISASSKAEVQKLMATGPNLVVLGTMAPAGEPFSIYKWLKSHPRYGDIPLLVIDARPEERPFKGWRLFEGMQMLAEDYTTKPIDPPSLVPRITSLLKEASRKIKVLVVDDHTMVRDGICALLGLQKDIEVIGEAVNGREAIDKVMRLSPDVTLMDIVMPVMNGLEATRRISKECPQTKVLILTQYDEEENMLVAKNAGAYGFIPKRAASAELVAGIRSVSGGRYFPAYFAEIAAS